MLTVGSVTARPVKVPLPVPHATASGVITDAILVLIDVRCGDVTGSAYAFVYSPVAIGPLVDLVTSIGALIAGEPLAPAEIFDGLQARLRILGTTGLVGTAIGGLDMALWDAYAKSLDAPLYSVLGGASKPIPIYESMGMMTPEDTVHGAAAAAELGVTAFKVKAGHPDPLQDRDVAVALRDVAGPDGDILFDYNQAFTPSQAIKRLRLIEDLGPGWIEEPVAASDLAGHAQVRAGSSVPVCTGENWWSAGDMQRAFDAGACDYAMIDAVRIGGVTGWMRAASVAAASNVSLSTHFFPEVSAHTMCVTPTAHLIEWLDVSSAIVREPLQVANGVITPSSRPGTGLEWNEAALALYSI